MTHFASDFFYYFFKTYLIIGPFFYLFTRLNQIKSTTYIVSLQTKQTNIVVNFLVFLQWFEELLQPNILPVKWIPGEPLLLKIVLKVCTFT